MSPESPESRSPGLTPHHEPTRPATQFWALLVALSAWCGGVLVSLSVTALMTGHPSLGGWFIVGTFLDGAVLTGLISSCPVTRSN